MGDADAPEAGASKKRPAEEQLTREAVAAEAKSEAAAAPAPPVAPPAPAFPSITAAGPSPFSAFAAAAAAGGGFGAAAAGSGGGFGGFKAAAAGGSGFGGFGAPAAGDGFPVVPPAFGGGGGRSGTAFGGVLGGSTAADDEDAAEEGGDDDEPPQPEFKPVCTLPEAPRVTGEEDETNLFSAAATLFAFEAAAPAAAAAGEAAPPPGPATWRERGRGEVRCNARAAGAGGDDAAPAGARLLMRAAGHFRLILNAALYPGMVVSVMDGGKGVSFACVNTADAAGASADVDKGGKEKAEKEGAPKGGMRTFAVRLRGADAEERTVAFKAAIDDALSRLPAKTSTAKADEDEDEDEPADDKGEKAAAGEEAV